MLKKTLKPFTKNLSNYMIFKPKYCYFNQQPSNFDSKKDYYTSLNVSKDASQSQIKKSYYRLAKQFHPDVNKGNQTKFKQISEAYQVLSNNSIRKQYDSARIFSQRWSQMGSKATSGNYQYAQYQNIYSNMTAQQRQQFTRQTRARLRRLGLYLGGFFIFWLLFTRTPHKSYMEQNGVLIPIDANYAYNYPDNMAQVTPYAPNSAANLYTPYGQPYLQPYIQQSPLYNQALSTNYQNQYPQSQYIQQNSYQGSPIYPNQPLN